MRKFLLSLLLLLPLLLWLCFLPQPAFSGDRCVGKSPTSITCDKSYPASAAGLQSALNDAGSGDTIYVEEGTYNGSFYFRYNGDPLNPITVISRKYDWLPCETCRITPSYLSVMPILTSNSYNSPALYGYHDAAGNPPKGWKFVGIAFMLGLHDRNHDNSIVATGGGGLGLNGVNGWYISDANNAPDSITFDRVVVASRFTDTFYAINAMSLNGSNISLKNSFLWPLFGAGIEVHGTAVLTGPGPLNIQNNFVSAMSIPIFSGGSAPDYVTGGPGSMTTTDNFIYRPWKWYPDKWNGSTYCSTVGTGGCYATANPKPTYFTSNRPAPTYGCVKNMSEHKAIRNFGLWERNVHENNWMDGGGSCAGQWFGFTLTVRQTGWTNPAYAGDSIYGSSWWMDGTYTPPGGCTGRFSPSGCVGSLTSSGVNFSWKSGMNPDFPVSQWIQPGNAVCQLRVAQSVDANYANLWNYDCRTVASITNLDTSGATWNTGTLKSPFTLDATHPSTTTTAAIDSTQLAVSIADTTNFNPYDIAKIGHEWVLICSVGNNVLNICPTNPWSNSGRGVFANGSFPERSAVGHASGTSVSKVVLWAWVQDPDAQIQNVTIQNSVFRNVGAGLNILAKDRVGWTPDNNTTGAGRVNGFTMHNVLFQDTVPNFGHNFAWKIYPQEQVTSNDNTKSGNDFLIENVTYDWRTKPWNVAALIGDGVPDNLHSKIQNMTIRSSIFPDASCADGNCYALSVTGQGGARYNSWTAAKDFTSGIQFFGNNQFAFVSTSCDTVNCPSNHAEPLAQNVTYNPNSYKLTPNSPLAKGAHDANDIGVNSDELPQIQNLNVTSNTQTALLEFDLTGPIQDAGSTQPCMLEVSTDESLHSYIGQRGPSTLPYTTINALNPAFFKQPDQSTTNNPLLLWPVVDNGHVSWPIGKPATVVGDDQVAHDISLNPLTTYYGRAMCFADTVHFKFRTAGTSSSAAAVPMQFKPPSGVASVSIEYGPTAALGSTVTGDVRPDGTASIQVPANGGAFVYTRTTYLDSDGKPVGQSVRKLMLP